MKKLTPSALLKMISSDGTSWADIRDAVILTNGTPKNWVTEVRNPLAVLIGTGKVVRTADVTKEIYIRLI